MYKFKLYEIENLKNIRENIFKTIFSLYEFESKKVLNILFDYRFEYGIDISEIEKWDKEILTLLINENFISKNYLEVKVVLKFCKLWKDYSIEYDLFLEENFKHEYIDIEKIFYSDLYDDSKEINQIDELIKDKIFGYIRNNEILDFEKLLFSLSEMYTLNYGNNEEYILNRNLSNLLMVITDDKLLDVVNLIVLNNYNLNFDENIIVSRLLKIKNKNEVEIFIENLSAKFKNRYKFSFYRLLEDEEINDVDANKLIELYSKNEDFIIVPFHTDFLLKYIKYDEDIILKISKILFEKSNIESKFLNGIELFFRTENQNINSIFKNNLELLKLIYLKLDSYLTHFDYNSKILNKILDMDNSFILVYLKQKNEEKSFNKKYKRLWERENYQKIIEKIIDYFFENQDIKIFGSKIKVFFNISERSDEVNKLEQKELDYLKFFITKNILNSEKIEFIFRNIISYSTDEQRKLLIKYAVELGLKFETFKELSLEKSSMSWQGSAVPMYQKRIEFFESLLESFEGLKYLEFKKHIEQIIEWKKDNIKREGKRDFLDDF